jgi:hypothetical protein
MHPSEGCLVEPLVYNRECYEIVADFLSLSFTLKVIKMSKFDMYSLQYVLYYLEPSVSAKF